MATLQDITNNPEALNDFNSLPRNERIKVINNIDPSFKELKLKDRFDVLNRIEDLKTPLIERAAGQALPIVGPAVVKGLQTAEDLARRGGAGLGVGAEKAITTPGSFKDRALQALYSSSNAMKPEYQPQPGEKIGYYAGKYAPEIAGVIGGLGKAAITGAELAATPSVKGAYEGLESTLSKKGLGNVVSRIPEDLETYAKGFQERLASTPKEDLVPEDLQRHRQLVTRIFNSGRESPKSDIGKILSKTKEEATDLLSQKIPEVGEALDTVKSAYQKEKLMDAIMKAAKVAGAGAAFEAGREAVGGRGVSLIRKVAAPFVE